MQHLQHPVLQCAAQRVRSTYISISASTSELELWLFFKDMKQEVPTLTLCLGFNPASTDIFIKMRCHTKNNAICAGNAICGAWSF